MKKCDENVQMSQKVRVELFRLYTMKKTRHIAFHAPGVRFLDENLNCISQVPWEEQMPDIDPILYNHSITASHKSWIEKGFIVTFEIDPSKINQVPRKS